MGLRFHLYNDNLGPLTVTNDPLGIEDLSQTVKRSEEFEGVVFEIIFNVDFIKEARRYLKGAYETDGGIDAIVNVSVYDWEPNLRKWEHYGTGKVNFAAWELDEETVTVNIDKVGVEYRVLNLMDTDVNLEGLKSENGSDMIPAKHFDVLYHSKAILKEMRLEPAENIQEDPEKGIVYLQQHVAATHIEQKLIPFQHDVYYIDKLMYGSLGLDQPRVDELETSYPQSYAYNELPTVSGHPSTVAGYTDSLTKSESKIVRTPLHVAKEEGTMDVNVKLTYRHEITAHNEGGDIDIMGEGVLGEVEIFTWFEHRASNDTIKAIDLIGQMPGERLAGDIYNADWLSVYFQKKNITVAVNDKFYVYETIRIFGHYEKSDSGTDSDIFHDIEIQANPKETYVSFANKTLFTPSVHKTVLMYEAIKKCVQYFTNIDDCFYSDLLGRTDLGYAVDGEASLIGLTSGDKLRSSTKPIILVLSDLLTFLNNHFCIGFGFEIVNDKMVFRVEKREHFYNKDLKSISIGPVNAKRKVNPKYFHHLVEHGFEGKLDIGQVNAIDEFNTWHRSIMPVINSKNKLSLMSKLRASGNQIEYQRRLAGTTIDSNLDSEIFVVSLVRLNEGFKTKSIEGYDLTKFENISNPESQYNFDFSPARILHAWKKILASNCIRSKSNLIRFGNGEINYRMVSKKLDEPDVIREDGMVELSSVEPLCDTEDYIFEFRLTRNEWKVLKANPYGVIEFFDRFGNFFEGFLNDEGIEYNSTKGTASFSLRRVNRLIIPTKPYDQTIKFKNFVDGVINHNLVHIEELKKEQPPGGLSRVLLDFIKIR